MCTVEFFTRSADDTERVAAAVGAHLRVGDRVDCSGELGAGKTVFARGLLRGLGAVDVREVCSPTFALHHSYIGGRYPMHHLDLYRIEDGAELLRQGVLDPLDDSAAVAFVEWPERLPTQAPPPALRVDLQRAGEEIRKVRLVFDLAQRPALLGALLALGL